MPRRWAAPGTVASDGYTEERSTARLPLVRARFACVVPSPEGESDVGGGLPLRPAVTEWPPVQDGGNWRPCFVVTGQSLLVTRSPAATARLFMPGLVLQDARRAKTASTTIVEM